MVGRNRRARSRARSSQRGAREDCAGFTLVEVMAAAVVIAVAVLGASSAILSSAGLTRMNRDTEVARQAVRQQIEELQSVPFREVFAAYNDDLADDAGLTVPAPGPGFNVPGLTPVDGDEDGMCGRIFLPVDPLGDPWVLREDLDDEQLGLPLDLDLDGVIDGTNQAADYMLLPVRVEVRWVGLAGERSTELMTVIAER